MFPSLKGNGQIRQGKENRIPLSERKENLGDSRSKTEGNKIFKNTIGPRGYELVETGSEESNAGTL